MADGRHLAQRLDAAHRSGALRCRLRRRRRAACATTSNGRAHKMAHRLGALTSGGLRTRPHPFSGASTAGQPERDCEPTSAQIGPELRRCKARAAPCLPQTCARPSAASPQRAGRPKTTTMRSSGSPPRRALRPASAAPARLKAPHRSHAREAIT